VASLGGFLIGWLAGYALSKQVAPVQRHENWAVAIGASVLGLAGVFAAFTYLGAHLQDAGLPGWAARWTQSLIIGLYVTVIAPVLFRILRLAR
jgi:predicted MFS family arabinose efflux permease